MLAKHVLGLLVSISDPNIIVIISSKYRLIHFIVGETYIWS
jgi:hypothetical protein